MFTTRANLVSKFPLPDRLVHLEDPDGVVSRTWLPSTEKDNSGALHNIAFTTSLVDTSKHHLLCVLLPIVLQRRLSVDQWMDATVKMALHEGKEREDIALSVHVYHRMNWKVESMFFFVCVHYIDPEAYIT